MLPIGDARYHQSQNGRNNLPIQRQFNANQPWSVVPQSSIEGGHYVPLLAKRDQLVCVSWGRTQLMDIDFYQQYCDEAWAIISPEMLKSGLSPESFDLAQLQADLAALQSS